MNLISWFKSLFQNINLVLCRTPIWNCGICIGELWFFGFWWLWLLPINIKIKWRNLCWKYYNQSIHYNQIEKYKYNGNNTELFHNNITANNMTLTKSSCFNVVEN